MSDLNTCSLAVFVEVSNPTFNVLSFLECRDSRRIGLINSKFVPYHTIYHTILYHTTPHHTTPRHTTPHHITPYHITPCLALPHLTLSYLTPPNPSLPYTTQPYQNTPNHAVLYYIILYHIVLYRTIPCYATPHTDTCFSCETHALLCGNFHVSKGKLFRT